MCIDAHSSHSSSSSAGYNCFLFDDDVMGGQGVPCCCFCCCCCYCCCGCHYDYDDDDDQSPRPMSPSTASTAMHHLCHQQLNFHIAAIAPIKLQHDQRLMSPPKRTGLGRDLHDRAYGPQRRNLPSPHVPAFLDPREEPLDRREEPLESREEPSNAAKFRPQSKSPQRGFRV